MRKFITRIIKFLIKLGVLGKVVTFRYTGKGISLNKFYSQGHWSTRHNIKQEYTKKLAPVIAHAMGKHFFEEFFLLIFYRSRHDVDNVVGMEKMLMDMLKGHVVSGDGNKAYKGLMMFHDKNLPMDTFEFILIESFFDDKKSSNK
jgi:hypothetical protein